MTLPSSSTCQPSKAPCSAARCLPSTCGSSATDLISRRFQRISGTVATLTPSTSLGAGGPPVRRVVITSARGDRLRELEVPGARRRASPGGRSARPARRSSRSAPRITSSSDRRLIGQGGCRARPASGRAGRDAPSRPPAGHGGSSPPRRPRRRTDSRGPRHGPAPRRGGTLAAVDIGIAGHRCVAPSNLFGGTTFLWGQPAVGRRRSEELQP